MSKLVTVPFLAAITVEIEDDSLSKDELIEKALEAANYATVKIDNSEIEESMGDGIYVDDFIEAQSYKNIQQGNFYFGYISSASIEEGW